MDSAGYQIRRATPGDALQLADLRLEFRTTQCPAVESAIGFRSRCAAWMAERLVPGAAWRCWVGAAEHRIIGTLWLQTVEKLPNPGDEGEFHGYVSSIYVRPENRGSGLATGLLRSCLDECDALGLDAVFLWCTPQSRRLYERYGFQGSGELLSRKSSPLTYMR